MISSNRDSIENSHYKVRFSLQNKITSSKFQYIYDEYYEYYNHAYSSGNAIYFNGNVSSINTINPELKIDFELPLWLKITWGLNYNITSFNTDYGELYKTYNSKKLLTTGYFKDETEFSACSTFLGAGFSRQHRKFNLDIDYSFSVYKSLYGKRTRSYYDENYNYLNTDHTKNFEYGGGLERFFFSNNLSVSLSYKIYKNFNLKLGYLYSFYLKNIYYEGPNYYTEIKKLKTNSLVFGVSFSIQ